MAFLAWKEIQQRVQTGTTITRQLVPDVIAENRLYIRTIAEVCFACLPFFLSFVFHLCIEKKKRKDNPVDRSPGITFQRR